MADNAAYRAAVQMAERDPRVAALLGSPIATEGLEGPSHIDDQTADLSIPLAGPKGSARLHAVGQRKAGAWQFSVLTLDSGFLRSRIDLAR